MMSDLHRKTGTRGWATLGAASVLAASAAVIATTPATASTTQWRPDVHGQAVPVSPANGRGRILYSQNDHDAGDGIVSAHFGPDYKQYTSRGADDFTIESGSWVIREIDVTGLYRFEPDVDSENVTFYRDKNDLPGAVLARFDDVVGNGTRTGSFNIPLGNGVTLPAGHYWVSVQVNGGQSFWVWETTSQQHGSPAAFKNPNDGFETGCLTFAVMKDCVGELGEGPDYMFLLQGSRLGRP